MVVVPHASLTAAFDKPYAALGKALKGPASRLVADMNEGERAVSRALLMDVEYALSGERSAAAVAARAVRSRHRVGVLCASDAAVTRSWACAPKHWRERGCARERRTGGA